jgi:NADH-quinone oxidoreductase subunit F
VSAVDLSYVDQVVERLGPKPEAVIPILQALQEHYHYLPDEALRRVCTLTQITPARIAGVASFYTQFRHQPRGTHLVRVCHGTACHVRGADLVHDALRHHLHLPADGAQDTSPDGQYTVESVACLGCCTLAPVVQIGPVTYGHLAPDRVPGALHDFVAQQAAPKGTNGHVRAGLAPDVRPSVGELRVGLGSCCMVKGSERILETLRATVQEMGVAVTVKRVGCVGACHQTPMVEVLAPGCAPVTYAHVQVEEAEAIARAHFRPRGLYPRLAHFFDAALENLALDAGPGARAAAARGQALGAHDPVLSAFMGPQVRIATEHFGELDPLDYDDYIEHDGLRALKQVLAAADAPGLITQIKASGLRGRGGAGFSTGRKWEAVRAAPGTVKYVICNGDEGDPGAFMDRMLLESFPYRVIEGLAIAAYAVGAHEGIFYIRAEYPLAVERVRAAIAECVRRGVLGDSLLGSGYRLDLQVKEGAGAFICGEETALIESLEGNRGQPRLKPPYPAQSGLWGRPTLVNNVETLAVLPWIIRHGAAAFAGYGTGLSRGTKVFALAGKVVRGGLIEVPMGISIRQIVEEIGGGTPGAPGTHGAGQAGFKAVQIGGPSGGCVPAALADTPVDYEALAKVGAIMGSGGLIVLDQSDCMVDIARYFLAFTQDQSCGQCTFCRVGTRRMLDILTRLCAGKGRKNDLEELEQLAAQVQQGSLCGLGRTAPNPVLTTLKYFRSEYEAHLEGRCPAGRCKALIKYRVTEACIGCTRCAQHCPADAIAFTPYRRHSIDMALCTRCDTCRGVCPVPDKLGNPTGGAILVE